MIHAVPPNFNARAGARHPLGAGNGASRHHLLRRGGWAMRSRGVFLAGQSSGLAVTDPLSLGPAGASTRPGQRFVLWCYVVSKDTKKQPECQGTLTNVPPGARR